MKVSVLTNLALINNENRKDAYAPVLQGFGATNTKLSEMHVLVEPEATRENVKEDCFNKLTKIEEVMLKSGYNNVLKIKCIQLESAVHKTQQAIKEAAKETGNDDFVNDFIK